VIHTQLNGKCIPADGTNVGHQLPWRAVRSCPVTELQGTAAVDNILLPLFVPLVHTLTNSARDPCLLSLLKGSCHER
ncbi:Os04g0677650, partial [Oryza sativa Japonica Group]